MPDANAGLDSVPSLQSFESGLRKALSHMPKEWLVNMVVSLVLDNSATARVLRLIDHKRKYGREDGL